MVAPGRIRWAQDSRDWSRQAEPSPDLAVPARLTTGVGFRCPRSDAPWVGRTPSVPNRLATRPFTLDDARAAGLTASALCRKRWRRIGSRLYCLDGVDLDPWNVLSALKELLPPDAVFAGSTAGWLNGLGLKPLEPVEVIFPVDSSLRSRFGLKVRRCQVAASEVIRVRGMPVTTLHRTLRDLCLRLPAVEALVALDMAVASRRTDLAALRRYIASAQGRPGVPRMRSLVEVAAAAESPMETRLRWALLKPGMPAPQVQTDLHDQSGRFIGRADLFYPQCRLVIEFDGGNHRDRLVTDDRRQNALVNAGFRVLRFTSVDVYQRPEAVVAQVRHALGAKIA